MGLWGTSADATTNKPKNRTTDTNSDYAKKDVFANNMGWVRRAGTAASGNDNADAQEEVLVAIGDLAGVSSSTGLKAPTITSTRFIVEIGFSPKIFLRKVSSELLINLPSGLLLSNMIFGFLFAILQTKFTNSFIEMVSFVPIFTTVFFKFEFIIIIINLAQS